MHRLIVGEGLTYFSQGFHLCPRCWWPLSPDGQRVDTTPEAVADAIASLVSSERGRDVLTLARSINQAVDATLEQLESRSTKATSASASIDGQHAGAQPNDIERGRIPVDEGFAALVKECESRSRQHASEAEANGQQHSHVDLAVVEAANEQLEELAYRLRDTLVAAMAEQRALQSMHLASEVEANDQQQSDAHPDAIAAAMDMLGVIIARLLAALIYLLVILKPVEAGASERNAGGSSIG